MRTRVDAPTITSIETAPLTLPLRGSRHGGGIGVEPIQHLLVRVKLSDGTIGNAEMPINLLRDGETLEGASVFLEQYATTQLKGKSIETALDRLWHIAAYNYSSKAALDMALHDAQARSQGQSLWDAINPALSMHAALATSSERVNSERVTSERVSEKSMDAECFIPISYQLEWGQTDAALEPIFTEVEQIIAQGVHRFKVMLTADIAKDIEKLKLLTESFRDAVFYVDAQGNLSLDNATSELELLRDIGAHSVANPLPYHYIEQRVLLRSYEIVPIVLGQHCKTMQMLELELRFNSFDILAIYPSQTGFSHSLQMMYRAHNVQRDVLVDSGGTSGLGTLYATMLASRSEVTYPCELSYPLKFSRDTILPSLSYADGYLDAASLVAQIPRVIPF